jgi:hypothetical protein
MRGLILFLPVLTLWGQTEEALKAAFEGKYVRTKVELPGTHDGLDVHYRKEPPVDMRRYQSRLNEWGAAVRPGVDIMVTAIRVKGKNIEFQLGGGGLNESSSVSYPTSVPKSRREEDLERDIRRETDSRRKSDMNRELDRLRSRRYDEERRRRAEKERLEEMKKRELREKAYRYGSRINLWFEKDYLKESIPTPQGLMDMLAEWVDFSPVSGAAPATRRGGFPSAVKIPAAATQQRSATALKRGLDSAEVHRLFGNPDRYKDSQQGTVSTRTEAFETDAETIEVDFVEGLVVRWRVNSK